MTDQIAEFAQFHHAYHSISAGRASAQVSVLRRLEASIDGPITSLTSGDLERFLTNANLAPTTIGKHLKMIRPFCRWMYRNRHITAEQLMDLREVSAPRGASTSMPKPYSRSEVQTFWREFDRQYPWTGDKDTFDHHAKRGEYWVRRWQETHSQFDWRHMRPYAFRLQAEAIIALALYGGLRRVEIFNLELDDADYEARYLRVTGAAKNEAAEAIERGVPMTTNMRVALSNWLEFRAQVLEPTHDRLWLALWAPHALAPMKFSTLAHLLRKVGKGYELHRMRHTFATERLRAGMPVETLQKVLGHSDIQMTLRYAQIGVEDVLRVADKTNDDFEAALAGDNNER